MRETSSKRGNPSTIGSEEGAKRLGIMEKAKIESFLERNEGLLDLKKGEGGLKKRREQKEKRRKYLS